MENLQLAQDFRSLQSEKTVSGLLPVQSVSLQDVCIEVLQQKGEWMSFLAELMSLIVNHNAVCKSYIRYQTTCRYLAKMH